jgi:hypothetical protein
MSNLVLVFGGLLLILFLASLSWVSWRNSSAVANLSSAALQRDEDLLTASSSSASISAEISDLTAKLKSESDSRLGDLAGLQAQLLDIKSDGVSGVRDELYSIRDSIVQSIQDNVVSTKAAAVDLVQSSVGTLSESVSTQIKVLSSTISDIQTATAIIPALTADSSTFKDALASLRASLAGNSSDIESLQSSIASMALGIAKKANQVDMDNVSSVLAGKANQMDLDSVNKVLAGKADRMDISNLVNLLAGKANAGDMAYVLRYIQTMNSALGTKASTDDMKTLSVALQAASSANYTNSLLSTLSGFRSTMWVHLQSMTDVLSGLKQSLPSGSADAGVVEALAKSVADLGVTNDNVIAGLVASVSAPSGGSLSSADLASSAKAAMDSLMKSISIKQSEVASLRVQNSTAASLAVQDSLAKLASSISDVQAICTGKLTQISTDMQSKASQVDLDALSGSVAGKASQTALIALQGAVNSKASQSDLTALSAAVDGKASQADLTALQEVVNSKASQVDVAALQGMVGKVSIAYAPPTSMTSLPGGSFCRMSYTWDSGVGMSGISSTYSSTNTAVPVSLSLEVLRQLVMNTRLSKVTKYASTVSGVLDMTKVNVWVKCSTALPVARSLVSASSDSLISKGMQFGAMYSGLYPTKIVLPVTPAPSADNVLFLGTVTLADIPGSTEIKTSYTTIGSVSSTYTTDIGGLLLWNLLNAVPQVSSQYGCKIEVVVEGTTSGAFTYAPAAKTYYVQTSRDTSAVGASFAKLQPYQTIDASLGLIVPGAAPTESLFKVATAKVDANSAAIGSSFCGVNEYMCGLRAYGAPSGTSSTIAPMCCSFNPTVSSL